MNMMNTETPFAMVEPIVILDKHSGVTDREYLTKSSYWLSRAAELVSQKRDGYYGFNPVGGETVELEFTNRELAFLIDGLQRISRTLTTEIASQAQPRADA